MTRRLKRTKKRIKKRVRSNTKKIFEIENSLSLLYGNAEAGIPYIDMAIGGEDSSDWDYFGNTINTEDETEIVRTISEIIDAILLIILLYLTQLYYMIAVLLLIGIYNAKLANNDDKYGLLQYMILHKEMF